MSIYSSTFNTNVSGNGLDTALLERELIQLTEQGLLGLLPHGVSEEETPKAKARRKDKDREDAFQTAALHAAILDQAFIRLGDAHADFNNRMEDLNERIEDRLVAIDERLNDPDATLNDDQRQALEDERDRLVLLQQEMLDEQQRIQDRVDDLNHRRENGDPIDPGEIDDLVADMERTESRLALEVENSLNPLSQTQPPVSHQLESPEEQGGTQFSIPVL